MSTKLIPVAISSQLDVTGEERIHTAPFPSTETVRPLWIGLSGDLTDGLVGDTKTGSYVSAGGVLPHTFSILSGTFPPGLTFLPDGSWSGTYTTTGQYSWVVQVIDSDLNTATLEDSAEVTDIACSASTSYDGGQNFPTEITVGLGTATGNVILSYATGPNPDKFEVWFDGVKVIDTGYHGDPSFSSPSVLPDAQTALDAYLTGLSLPTEAIVMYPGGFSDATEQWDSVTGRETINFTKSTNTSTATVRVYGPLPGTLWYFSLSCPA